MKRLQCIYMFLLVMAATSFAIPIDLYSFYVHNFDYAASGTQPAASWTIQPDGMSIIQTVNSDPSMFLSGVTVGDLSFSGTIRETDTDDDFIGFVFGYQGDGAFYLFDWKQAAQTIDGGVATRGITLKRFDSVPTTWGHFWSTTSVSGVMTQLYHQDLARTNGTTYGFSLHRVAYTGEITITISQGATTLADFTVFDSTYNNGEYGFYSSSEGPTVYFTGLTGDVTLSPEPSTYVLLSICAFLAWFVKKNR